MLTKYVSVALLVSVLSTSAAWAQKLNYLSDIIDIPQLIPPPPLRNSPEEKRDLDEVLEFQENRTEIQLYRARAEKVLTIYHFADVLGPKFKAQNLPVMDAFFQRMQADARAVLFAAKNTFQRPRPIAVSDLVVALAGTPRLPTGYPSGGTIFCTSTAIVLAKMIPEKRHELFERNREIGIHRIVIGEHFPLDIRAGEIAATVITHELMKNPAFMSDLQAARAELRQVLGYPVEPEVTSAVKSR